MRAVRWSVLGLGVLSVVFWLLSYSWLAGYTPPTRWISQDASPWLVAEVAAIVVGVVALLAGLALRVAGRAARWGAILGGVAAVLSAASLAAMP